MSNPLSTLKKNKDHAATEIAAVPGVLLLFSQGLPASLPLPLSQGTLTIERGDGRSPFPIDRHVSRKHARLTFRSGQWLAEDLGSQNGTTLDGQVLRAGVPQLGQRILRTGESIYLLCEDLRPYQASSLRSEHGRISGPVWERLQAHISRAARFGTTLHIRGETGVGKEGAARAFHAASPNPAGPFVAVNCAAIPSTVAERLLFGAKRGAFSGAVSDTDGYIQAADGGTLFFDEISELDMAVQAKLLRVLETREVYPLGATRGRTVNLRVCTAGNKDLRAEVAAGRFRDDLYFRLSRPEVEIPPLRKRPEEIPWLLSDELRKVKETLRASADVVEASLLREWPGNVRELLTEFRAAGQNALGEDSEVVEIQHLSATAGHRFDDLPSLPPGHPPIAACLPGATSPREGIERVLRRTAGNVSAAARLLGVHRNVLRRQIEQLGIDVSRYNSGSDPGTDLES